MTTKRAPLKLTARRSYGSLGQRQPGSLTARGEKRRVFPGNKKGPHTWTGRGSHRLNTMAVPVALRSSVLRRPPLGRQDPAPRTASASRAAVGLPLPRRLNPAPPPAHAVPGAWPGERVWREPGAWVRPPTWLSPFRQRPKPVLNTSGLSLSNALDRESTQKPASRVLDSRQATTYLLCLSMTATR